MNEDYLWDKTGSDSEIENLEDVFSSLRYRPSPPPALEKERPEPFGWLKAWLTPTVGLLTASTLIFGVGTGWQIAKLNSPGVQPAAEIAAVKIESERPSAPAQTLPAVPETKRFDDRMSVTNALHVPAKTTARRTEVSGQRRRAKSPATNSRDNRITREELQAYQKVMLALSIASDKLKIVSEAANGTED
jgi:hypothetical protein